MPYGAILSFFSNWRNLVIIALVAVCIGLFIHGLSQSSVIVGLKNNIADQRIELADAAKVVEQLKTDIAQRDFDIGNLNTELNLIKTSIDQKDRGIEALQVQVKKLLADSDYWYQMAEKRKKAIAQLTSTEAAKLVKEGKVVDENSSVRLIEQLNSTVFNDTIYGGTSTKSTGVSDGKLKLNNR
jgi:septal ring factor EnvC (AmiA/AmiB activator)